MPLQADSLGRALGEQLHCHTNLCRREIGAFQQAAADPAGVVVACTQEAPLFTDVAQGASAVTSPLRFVDIRETGGWSRDAAQAMPKIAALLAMAHLPDPDPVPAVAYRSEGRLLVIGPAEDADACARLFADALQVTVFATTVGTVAQPHAHPLLAGRVVALDGWLGAFRLDWEADNPISLDLCTRCNACVAACPEGAIGLDWQIDLARCASHRECMRVCQVGAVDFERAPQAHSDAFDLVLDLRERPAFTRHALPEGYVHLPGGRANPRCADAVVQLRQLVGEFEKPKFFDYRQRICAHSRNDIVGCDACVRICSADAIASDRAHQQVRVEPHLCVGCGACTTVCPTGALTYTSPSPATLGTRMRTALATYAKAGGRDAVLLLHAQEAGTERIEALGRMAALKRARGLPANVIPLPLWHAASTGIDLWLSAIAFGAAKVAVLLTGDEAPQYAEALRTQMEMAQAILDGLGYAGSHFIMIAPGSITTDERRESRQPSKPGADALDDALAALSSTPAAHPTAPAAFAVTNDKRGTLELALQHLAAHAPQRPSAIALPPAAPYGAIVVDGSRCTLCMSCVGACPAGALQDTPTAPQLKFIEANCVQCGLCASTCPEDAITLQPRLLLDPARREPRVVAETQPYACIRCGKPFGTLRAVEAMLDRLAGHAMFQGAARERLRMCGDCRVIDIHSATDEVRITDA